VETRMRGREKMGGTETRMNPGREKIKETNNTVLFCEGKKKGVEQCQGPAGEKGKRKKKGSSRNLYEDMEIKKALLNPRKEEKVGEKRCSPKLGSAKRRRTVALNSPPGGV